MNLKDFKAISHDKDSYTIQHPSGKILRVEKAGLHRGAHSAIKCLYQGGQADQDAISAMGGGDPMASFTAADKLAASAGPSMPFPSAAQGDYKEYAPDITPADVADLDAPSRGGGVSTDAANVAQRARDKAKVDAVRATEGPVPGDADYVPPSGAPTVDQAVTRAQADLQGRSPDAGPVSSDPLIQEKSDVQQLLGTQIQQQQEGLAASQAAGQNIADIQQGEAAKLGALPSYNDIVSGYQAKDQKLAQAYADAKIDPQHFYHSMGTGSKILTGIGMVLSGMGSATTGQPSYAMQVINDAVKRDVEAQSTDQSQKLNLWKMNREAMGNDVSANLATENQIKAAALAKLQAAQTSAALPVEKLRAQQAIDQLQQEMLQNNLRRGLLTQGAQAAQGAPGSALSQADPAMLVPEMVKDPAQQKQAYEEIKNRQNISKNGQKMLQLVQQAAQDTHYSPTNALGYKPSSVLSLESLMAPNFTNIDGTVRQGAMDVAYNTMIPNAFDTDERRKGKIQAMANWIHSQEAAPVSKGNYIDLDRFQSTAIPNAPAAPKAAAGQQTQVMHGHTYQKVPGGWKLVK